MLLDEVLVHSKSMLIIITNLFKVKVNSTIIYTPTFCSLKARMKQLELPAIP